MPRPKAPPDSAPPTVEPSGTTHLFARRQTRTPANLTHERIATDLAAFKKAGGKIEVLGVTNTLKHVDADSAAHPPRPANAPRSRR